MIGWLAAQSDAPNYGRAVSFAFPNGATVYGPTQVEAAVNQDPTVSQQLTLWGQEGSHVVIGNLLVMPIEDSLLYVQPLYLESSQTAGAAAQARDRLLSGEHVGRRDRDRRPAAGGDAAHLRRRPHRDLRRGAAGGRQRHARRPLPHDDAHRAGLVAGARPDRPGQPAVPGRPGRAQGRRLRAATARRSRRSPLRSRRCRPPSSARRRRRAHAAPAPRMETAGRAL